MKTLSGWGALVRAAAVIVGEVLWILVVVGVREATRGETNPVLAVVIMIVTAVAVLGGLALIARWAIFPWLSGRTERRLWQGNLDLDQAEILRLRGLSDRRARQSRLPK